MEGEIAVPVYLNCPHCEHPQVVPTRQRGRTLFCRQCGRAYRTSEGADGVQGLPISSMGELDQRLRARKGVQPLAS